VLKKAITYEDFNGETVTEDFYFNLSRAELVELETSHKGGLAESIKKIVEDEDGAAIIAEFKKIVLKAYGYRSSDGRRFIKNQDLRDEFESTEAYSVLFMEMVTDAEAAAKFINGVVPQGVTNQDPLPAVAPNGREVLGGDVEMDPKPEPRKLTQAEVMDMDEDELKSGLATGRYAI
jgi:hypothetical protein